MFYIIFINQAEELDLINETIEDYTLVITNIPKNSTYHQIVHNLTHNNAKIKPIEILPIFKLKQYKEISSRVKDFKDVIRYMKRNKVRLKI